MTIYEVFTRMTGGEIAGWALVAIIILFSLIQVAPIKVNPWDSILGWFGKKINGKMQGQLDEMHENLGSLQKQVTDIWINNHRQSILTFARECRSDIVHDREEWNHILAVADDYEMYCIKNTVSNGVVKADTEYVRGLYQELSREHKI